MVNRLKILDRYVISEMAYPFLLGVIGFVLIMIVDLLFTLTDLIVNKGIPIFAVIKLMIFKLPAIMVLTFPVSTLFATAWVVGRMARDSEVTALRTSGITLMRISFPIINLALMISLLAFVTNERIVPWANNVSDTIIRQIILKRPLPDIEENVFFRDGNDRTFYLKKLDSEKKIVEGIVVYETKGEAVPRTVMAKRGRFNGSQWLIEDGVVHKYDDSG
ncbi:MAG: LptF/LptG family permease, partial [bacterium]